MKRWALCIILMMLATGDLPLRGDQQKPHTYMIYSPGTASCGTWTAARESVQSGHTEDVRRYQFQAFMAGYISAYNRYVHADGDVLHGLDTDGMVGGLDKWCADHPTQDFFNAVEALMAMR